MKRRKFLLGILAAGLGAPGFAAAARRSPSETDTENLLKSLRRDGGLIKADHRSHSSHSSHRSSSGGGGGHRSHSSHRSSNGGGGRRSPSPAPAPSRRSNSTPPDSILPKNSSPSGTGLAPDTFVELAKRVQQALKAKGYYNGPVDGIIGKDSKAAIALYQIDQGLDLQALLHLNCWYRSDWRSYEIGCCIRDRYNVRHPAASRMALWCNELLPEQLWSADLSM